MSDNFSMYSVIQELRATGMSMQEVKKLAPIIYKRDQQIVELQNALKWSRDNNTGHEPSVSVMHRYYDELIPSTGESK